MAQAAVKPPDTLTDADFANAPATLTDADFGKQAPKQEENSFFTSPHGFIREGARTIGQGVKELFTPGSREAGATHVIKGAGSMLAPVGIGAAIPALVAAPAATLGGLAAGGAGMMAGGAGGRKLAEAAGGGPQAQELAGTIGETVGGGFGGAAGASKLGQGLVRGAAQLPAKAIARVSPDIAKDVGRLGGYVAGHAIGGWPGGFIASKLGSDLAAKLQGAAAKSVGGAADESAELLEGIAKGQWGKSYDKLTPFEQSAARNIADRISKPNPVGTPRPAAAPTPEAQPIPKAQPVPESQQAAPSPNQTTKPAPTPVRPPLAKAAQPAPPAPAPAQPISRVDQLLKEARDAMVAKGLLPAERNLGELPHGTYKDRFDVGSNAPIMQGPQTKILKASPVVSAKPDAMEIARKLAEAMKENQ